MKRRQLLTVLAIALALGGLAAYLTVGYLDRPVVRPDGDATAAEIAVAARDLAPGAIVGESDVALVSWPADALPAGHLDEDQAVGRGVVTPVYANEPLLANKLADPSAGGGLPVVIPPGKRAVSVEVDEVIGVAGFVAPGTRVDVIVTLAPRSEGERDQLSRIVLQNIRTLATGHLTQPSPEGEPTEASVVTLLVDPEQAEILTLAAHEGRIQLALRNTLDVAERPTPGIDVATLAGVRARTRPAAARARRASPPTTKVEVYRGSTRDVITF